MAHPKRTVYDLLAKQAISEITAAQLDASVASTRVDKATIDFWTGPITLHRVLEMRCYPHGLPIPEKSVIVSSLVPAGESVSLQPSGTEIFQVTAIQVQAAGGTPTVSVSNFDGSTSCVMHSGTSSTDAASFFPWESVLPITTTNYLRVDNADLSNAVSVTFAYHVVSL